MKQSEIEFGCDISSGQYQYRNQTLFHVVWSVPAKVFLTVTFSIWSILTDHDLFGSDVEQDWSYTVFALGFFYLNRLNFMSSVHSIGYKRFAFGYYIKNPSRALRILSLSELISSKGMSSLSLKERSRREKWSETAVGW